MNLQKWCFWHLHCRVLACAKLLHIFYHYVKSHPLIFVKISCPLMSLFLGAKLDPLVATS